MPSSGRGGILRQWLRGAKPPAAVRRQLDAAIRGLPGASTEVAACDNCGRTFFLADMDDMSTQEAPLLLCSVCSDERRRLRASGVPHLPHAGRRAFVCVCGEPDDSPYHLEELGGF